MKVQKKQGWALLCILFWANLTLAQHYGFKTLGLAEGLPTKSVNCMLQDSRGLYWFGTDGSGLVRYDGYTFTLVSKDLTQPLLFVYSITEDAKGNLWLGTERGVVRYDGKHFSPFLSSQTSSTEQVIYTHEGLYSITQKGDLYNLRQDSLQPVPTITECTGLASFGNKTYIGTTQGLFQLGNPIVELDTNPVLSLFATDSNLIYSTLNGLKSYNKHKKTINAWTQQPWKQITANKTIIAGTDGENWYIRSKKNLLNLNEANGLPKQTYAQLYLDNNSVLWGIGNESLVQLHQFAWSSINTPNGSAVSAIATYKGNTFVASNNQLWQLSKSLTLEPINGPTFGTVQGLAEYNNKLYLATERGLFVYNGNTIVPIRKSGVFNEFIFSIHSHSSGLWLGTGVGLFRLENNTLYNEGERYSLPPATVYGISEAPDGALWFGTYFNGFYRFYDGQWLARAETALNLKMDSLQILNFTAAAKDALWINSVTEGLIYVSPKGKVNVSNNQLNFAEINSLSYQNDVLWAGTNKGIYQVYAERQNKSSFICRKLINGSESTANLANTNALLVGHNKVLCGTQNGLQQLIPSQHNIMGKLQLQLTDVELFYGDVSGIFNHAQDTLRFTGVPEGLKLPYDLNFINLSLAGIHPIYAKNLLYRYRLRGQNNDEWTNAGKRREAVFSSLKPGDYVFEAQMSLDGLDWSTPLLQYAFSIETPYYRTWWFISIWVLVAGGITYLIVNERIKRINQKLLLENQLINMERKALRLQMNPHFIFNALDSISSFIFKQDPKMAVRYLNNFAKLMRLTLESSMEHLHPVETEVSILKNYLELEQLRFQNKFSYDIELDEDFDFDIGIPPMLIQPHVENAILHGLKPKAGNDGRIIIRFILDGDFLICEIEDNGIGRKAAKELGPRKDHRSMATRINKDRIRLLKEALNDDISINIIDKFEPNGTASGTKVVIKLFAESV